MSAYDAYRTARTLAQDGLLDSDALTIADMDAAADQAGARRPEEADDRHAVRAALDSIRSTP
ncbi:hypothetical protein [Streptomyces prasinus]